MENNEKTEQCIKISVIIPVYNVEKYLPQCVDSVLSQSYQNLEIILVDDGSSDQSGQICDQYGEKDPRVRVIHKTNGGLSDARNAGIQQAAGEYLLFLDSDDFWSDHEAIQRLVLRAQCTQPDVINFSYIKFEEDTGIKVPYISSTEAMPDSLSSKAEQLSYLTNHALYIASACNKMIRRSLFSKGLLFAKGVFSEDIEWSARLLIIADSFDFVPENFYCYRQRSGSISHSISLKNCQDIRDHIIFCVHLAEKAEPCVKNAIYRYTAFQLGTYVKNQAFSSEDSKTCNEDLQQYQWLFRYHGNNKKLKVLYILNHLVPFGSMCSFFRIIYRSKRS